MVRFSLFQISKLRLRLSYFLGLFRFGHYWVIIAEAELRHRQVELHWEIHHRSLGCKHSWHLSHLHQLLNEILHHIRLSWSHHLSVVHYSEPLTLFHLLRLKFPAASLHTWGALFLLPSDFPTAFQRFISQVNVLVIIILGVQLLVIDVFVISAVSVAVPPSLAVARAISHHFLKPLFFDDGWVAGHYAGLPSLLQVTFPTLQVLRAEDKAFVGFLVLAVFVHRFPVLDQTLVDSASNVERVRAFFVIASDGACALEFR